MREQADRGNRVDGPRVIILVADTAIHKALRGALNEAGMEPVAAADARIEEVDLLLVDLGHPRTRRLTLALCDQETRPAIVALGQPVVELPIEAWLPSGPPDPSTVTQVLITALRLRRSHETIAQLTKKLTEAEAALRDNTPELETLGAWAELGRAAKGLHHDVNNPTCAIILNAQLLLMSLGDRLDTGQLDRLRAIESNADRIRTLTARLAGLRNRAVAADRSVAEVGT